jgi:hypothetical protein
MKRISTFFEIMLSATLFVPWNVYVVRRKLEQIDECACDQAHAPTFQPSGRRCCQAQSRLTSAQRPPYVGWRLRD